MNKKIYIVASLFVIACALTYVYYSKNATKTYINEELGVSFDYPKDLSVTEETPLDSTAIKMLRIYDANYITKEGSVGQDVRSEMRDVSLSFYDANDINWERIKSRLEKEGELLDSRNNVFVYRIDGLAGPYIEALKSDTINTKPKIILGVAFINYQELLLGILNYNRENI